MVSLEVIEQEIMDLERRDTSYAVCERLCWLYTVRDHLRAERKEEAGTSSYGRTLRTGGSEFLDAASGCAADDVMCVIGEHMEAIRAVAPREYDAVVTKLRSLHDAHQAQDQLDVRDA